MPNRPRPIVPAAQTVQTPAQPVSGFGLMGEAFPTVPVVYRDELPRCVGACSQGAWPCRHPLACSIQQCSDTEWADIRAELTTDHAPRADPAPDPAPTTDYPLWWWLAMTLIALLALWALAFTPNPQVWT